MKNIICLGLLPHLFLLLSSDAGYYTPWPIATSVLFSNDAIVYENGKLNCEVAQVHIDHIQPSVAPGDKRGKVFHCHHV